MVQQSNHSRTPTHSRTPRSLYPSRYTIEKEIKGVCERNDERTKASLGVGKSMTKNTGIIAQSAQHNRIHSLNRTVLINERSMKDRGDIGVVKGHQMIVMNRNKIIPKKG